MQLTNGYIFYGFEALQKLAKLPMPAKTSFAVAKATRKLGEVYQDIREIRNSLIMKYGAETEPGKKKIEPGDPNWSEFVKEHNDLMGIEVEVDIAPFALPDNMTIEPDVLIMLEKLIVEP